MTGAVYDPGAPWLDAANAYGLFFDAKTDQVEIAAGPLTNLHLLPNGITVEAIVRPAELPLPPDAAGQRISYVFWADDGSYDLMLLSDASGATTLRGSVNLVGGVTGPCSAVANAPFMNATGFSHLAMTYADELLQLYIDGMAVAAATAAGGCGSQVGPVGFRDIVRIGNDETAVGFPSNDRAFRGWIDEVRISDEALDPRFFVRTAPSMLYSSNWSQSRLERWHLGSGAQLGWNSAVYTPRQQVVGPDGDLYVAYQTTDRVGRHDRATGNALAVFASGSGLDSPLSLAFGPDGNLYVNSQAPDQLLRYDGTTGAFIDAFVPPGTLLLGSGAGMKFGPEGDLYVVSDLNQIYRYDGQTGAFIDVFTSGSPERSMNDFVFGPDGLVYASITDPSQVSHVFRFDGLTGAYLDEFVTGGSGGLDGGSGLAFGPGGDLYVASFFGQQILRYDGQTGAFLGVFADSSGQTGDLLFVPEPPRALLVLVGGLLLARLGAAPPARAQRRKSCRARSTISASRSQTSSTTPKT